MELLIVIVGVGALVALVALTERVRVARRASPGEEEAKARSTGDESMNSLP